MTPIEQRTRELPIKRSQTAALATKPTPCGANQLSTGIGADSLVRTIQPFFSKQRIERSQV